jgi:hypothetical protein
MNIQTIETQALTVCLLLSMPNGQVGTAQCQLASLFSLAGSIFIAVSESPQLRLLVARQLSGCVLIPHC